MLVLGASWVSVSEILEVRGHTEVATTYKLNYSLQVIFLFACDSNLPVL